MGASLCVFEIQKKDSETNIWHIDYVASEIFRHGGVSVCAAVNPCRATRNDLRNMVRKDYDVEVLVDTLLTVCEQRDMKGLYTNTHSGEIIGFTDIDDPCEEPHHAEIRLETAKYFPDKNERSIVDYLPETGFVVDQE